MYKSVCIERSVSLLLTNREYKLFLYFCEHPNDYLTSSRLGEVFNVSSRTIKNDLEALKDYSKQFSFLEISTKKGKGTHLVVKDLDKLNQFISSLKTKNFNKNFDDKNLRIKRIILYLLTKNQHLSKYNLQEKFFVSESTLYHDIQQAKKLVQKYNLNLVNYKNQGYKIIGKEENKRECILNESLFKITFDDSRNNMGHIEFTTQLTENITRTIDKYEYSISDFLLQNLLMHITLMLERIENNYVINELSSNLEDIIDIEKTIEYKISEEILYNYINKDVVNNGGLQYEIYYLAINLLSKNEFKNNSIISEEVYKFIDSAFAKIKLMFGVDFTQEIDFKNAIALHVAPLLTRIKLNMQLKSKLSTEIKQSFPVATNIASYLSQLIYETFQLQANDDEISYLTSYFNYGLQRFSVYEKQKNVLLISSLRYSETMLLKDRILDWFKNQVSNITISDPRRSVPNITDYDAILTTENELSKYKGSAVKVNVFPNDQDFMKINLAINGFDSLHSIISKFSKELTFKGKVRSKKEIIDVLCNLAKDKFNLDDELKENIYSREEQGDTYFGHYIAMPHPLTPTTNQSFVALGLLDEPIEWGNNELAKLVILVSIEKNNPKAFQLWHYLSSLVTNKDMVLDLYNNLTYEKFISQLEFSLQDVF